MTSLFKPRALARVATAAALVLALLPCAGCSGNAHADDPVVATVNGQNLYASTLTDYIDSVRSSVGSSTDAAWEAYLADQGHDVDSYWNYLIEFFAKEMLVHERCEELGIRASDDEVDEQIEYMKNMLGATGESSSSAWESYLQTYGYASEDELRSTVRYSLAEGKLYEQEVPVPEPSEEEVQSFANSSYSAYSSTRSAAIGTEDYALARDLLEELIAHPGRFEQRARECSELDNAEQGGDMGYTILNSFNSDYLSVLEQTEPGQVYPETLLQGEYYCIVKVTGEYTAELGDDGNLDLDAMPAEIRAQLESNAADYLWSRDCGVYLQQLYDSARIEILVEHQYDIPGQSHGNEDSDDAAAAASGEDSDTTSEQSSGAEGTGQED